MRDRDVRQSVWSWLEQQHAGDVDTLMLDELGVLNGTTRIDIAVVNGELTGFELKSERDTLERLPAQRDAYSLVFDRVSLVVAENHLAAASEIIPYWWGVWVACNSEGSVIVRQEREALANETQDAETICSFLWREEALSILHRLDAAKGVKSKPREVLYRRLAEVLPLDEIKFEVRAALKGRQGWRVDRRPRRCDGSLQ